MATTRIKDITTAASTFSSDDFVAIDGATSGTRKMAKADLISEVSSGVSGTYLEESNNLSDVASLDTSKLNMEIPDVGTAPNEVPLNGMLGDMAYQSSESVSMGTAEVETLEVTDKVTGQLGVGASPSYDLHVTNTSSSAAIGITGTGGSKDTWTVTSSDGGGKALLNFRDEDTANTVMSLHQDGKVGIGVSPSAGLHLEQASTDNVLAVVGQTGYNGTLFLAAAGSGRDTYLTVGGDRNLLVDFASSSTPAATGTTKFTFSKLGNLVMTGGGGIDFGSGATFDNYEHGDITSVTDASGAGLGITADLKYQVIGKSVQISGKIIFPVTADTNAAQVTLLPEQCPNDDGARGLSISYSTIGSAFYVLPLGGTNDVMFYTVSGSTMSNNALSGVAVFISGNYSIN